MESSQPHVQPPSTAPATTYQYAPVSYSEAQPQSQQPMYPQQQQPMYVQPPQQYAPPPQGYYQAPPGQPPPQAYYPPPQQGYPQQQYRPAPAQMYPAQHVQYAPAPGQPAPVQQMPQQPPPQQQQPPPPQQQPTYTVDSLSQVERATADMTARGMTNDPRYHQMISVANRLRQQAQTPPEGAAPTMAGAPSASQSSPAATPAQAQRLSEQEQAMFEAQVNAYRTLARQLPLPVDVAQKAMRDPTKSANSLLPEPYAHPGTGANNEKLPYNLMSILQLHQQRAQNRQTSVPRPGGIDPATIAKERENRIANRIGERIAELEQIVATVSDDVRIKVEIELRSLRLLNLQKQIRAEVLALAKRDTTLETALNPNAYRRTKKQALKEARVTEKLEKQQKQAQERKRRERHREFLDAIVNHSREFKEFHRNNFKKTGNIKRAVLTYHANAEKERRKDEERREKERMQKLMQEDEEGYRKLLDQKKDKRLVFLLSQTDEYISSLTGLVATHQESEARRKKEERKAARRARRAERERLRAAAAEGEDSQDAKSQDETDVDLPVHVRDTKTGHMLHGDDAPKASQLDEWLKENPGYEVVARGNDDSSSSSESEAEEHDDDEAKERRAREKLQREREEERKRIEAGEVIPEEGDIENKDLNKSSDSAGRHEDDEYEPSKGSDERESYYSTAHRIREKVTKQPTILTGGELKPYQVRGLEWLVSLYNNNLNGILADEMGLGKTIQTIALITYLMEYKKLKGPFLIIVPLSTLSNWDLEFTKWAPSVTTVLYKGVPQHRRNLQARVRNATFNVLMTTYDYIIKDKSTLSRVKWKYMIIDEGHRMKNHHNKLTSVLNQFYSAPHRLLLTGTPLQNKLPELWALLNFLLPSIFKSVDTFEQWFNKPFATTGERMELNPEETMLIIRRLHKVLRPFLLRRLKKEVESQLPEKTEYVIKCDMSQLQRILYRSLEKGLLVGGSAGTRAVMNTVMQLRKLCNHPFLFENVEDDCLRHWSMEHATGKELMRVSGKFELLDRILPKLRETGHKVLLFCQMTQLMTIMEDYFNYKGFKYLRLDGSTKPDERGDLLARFNAPDSEYFVFILSTRAGGLGLNLQTADTVIIFDSDWNPHQDLQAQDRAHRIGQSREVRVLRLLTVQSIEERILAAARNKLNMDSKVIQAGLFDNRSTNAERKKFLEQIIHAEIDDDEENDVPDDETINQMLARSEEEFDKFQQMDIERRRAEAADIKRRSRLIEEEEVPRHFYEQSKVAEQMQTGTFTVEADKALFGQGKRQRKEVNYAADLMSDRDWLREYADEDVGEDEYPDNEDDAPTSSRRGRSAASTGRTRGRKRKGVEESETPRKRRAYIEEDDEEPVEETPRRSRGRRGPRAKSPPPDYVAPICQQMYNTITRIKTSDDRILAEPFIKLPTPRELPEYYERIERPMDFVRIEKKIKANRYRSIEEITADVHLLCANAQEYNMDESLIFTDSIMLQKTWDEMVSRLSGEIAQKKAAWEATRTREESDASRSQSRAESALEDEASRQSMQRTQAPPTLQPEELVQSSTTAPADDAPLDLSK